MCHTLKQVASEGAAVRMGMGKGKRMEIGMGAVGSMNLDS